MFYGVYDSFPVSHSSDFFRNELLVSLRVMETVPEYFTKDRITPSIVYFIPFVDGFLGKLSTLLVMVGYSLSFTELLTFLILAGKFYSLLT